MYGMLSTISALSFGLIGFLGWGIKKVYNINGKKNDIKVSFDDFFTDYLILKNKILQDIENFYNNNINDIDDIVKSQNQDMSGIILNIDKWNELVVKFEKIKMKIKNELK